MCEENFIASSLGERTLAFNNFTAFQKQRQAAHQGNYLHAL
jgi:hypothetical protein